MLNAAFLKEFEYILGSFEAPHEKTCLMKMRKQRCRSAAQ